MARLTSRDTLIRGRWQAFLKPLVGRDGGRISVTAFAKRLAELTKNVGDLRGEVYAYLNGTQTVQPPRAYWCGEALRSCGIGWSTGFGALWSAGYLGEFARRVIALAQTFPEPDPPVASGWSMRDLAVYVGTHAPIFASPGLARYLLADDYWVSADRRGWGWFTSKLPDGTLPGWSDTPTSRKNRYPMPEDEMLVHAATFGDDHKIELEIRERVVWTLIFEWAIIAASAGLREGRIANLAGLVAARPRWLIESKREADVARGRSLQTSSVDRRSTPHNASPSLASQRIFTG